MTTNFLAVIVVFILIAVYVSRIKFGIDFSRASEIFSGPALKHYQYTRKRQFMTNAESEFYRVLMSTVGEKYQIFSQVHLPTLLEHTSFRQNWKGALGYVIRNSVDFVLCNKESLEPLLVIELDDKSHLRPDRVERDRKIEHILRQAGMPLLRIPNLPTYDREHLKKKVDELALK